jgi:ATP-binding cassette subfamily C protein
VTIIVVTQRPALLNIVDKVLILRAGRADAFGPPKDVLRRALVAKPTGTPQPPDTTAQGAPQPALARTERLS